jgi:TolA-binding protein
LIDAGEFENALHKIDKTLANQTVVKNLKGILLQKKALCLRRLKKYEESITVLQTILNGPFKKEQKESAVFQSASINRNELHNFDAAISDLRRYTHDYPDGIWSEEVHYTLAELLHLKKDFDGAVSVYKKTIDTFSKSPRSESALYSLASLYSRDLSDCNRALNTYIRLETDFPESKFSEDASFWKADCLFSQGRISQALKAYREYLDKYPKGKWVAEARARVKTTATVGIDK